MNGENAASIHQARGLCLQNKQPSWLSSDFKDPSALEFNNTHISMYIPRESVPRKRSGHPLSSASQTKPFTHTQNRWSHAGEFRPTTECGQETWYLKFPLEMD